MNSVAKLVLVDCASCMIAVICSSLSTAGESLVIQNESAQRLVVHLRSLKNEEAQEAASCTVPPRGVNSLELEDQGLVSITIQWFALEGQLAYEYRADNIDLSMIIRYSKRRPMSRRIEFQHTAIGREFETTGFGGSELTSWQAVPPPERWLLGLWCTGTTREALLNFRQLAIADPQRPIPARAPTRTVAEYRKYWW